MRRGDINVLSHIDFSDEDTERIFENFFKLADRRNSNGDDSPPVSTLNDGVLIHFFFRPQDLPRFVITACANDRANFDLNGKLALILSSDERTMFLVELRNDSFSGTILAR